MRKAIVTVDLGFGDSGKGSIVDYLCRTKPVDLVVRYSGGSQCGHNVVTPEGQHHCFSQFGSGTFAGVKTYLDRQVIVDPVTLENERLGLKRLDIYPELEIHPDCLIVTPYHKLANTLRHKAREHGSCGMGIGDVKDYWLKYGLDAVKASDLDDRSVLHEKLELLRYRLLEEYHSREVYDINPRKVDLRLNYPIDKYKPYHEFAVFEAAQGVLLDEYFGFYPHNTWTTVTSDAANVDGYNEVEYLGITRPYHTRHGAGPLPTNTSAIKLRHEKNTAHPWQGDFRVGWLDMQLLQYALIVNPVNSIAVNCVDDLPARPFVCTGYTYKGKLLPGLNNGHYNNEILYNAGEPVYQQTDPLAAINLHCDVSIIGTGPTWKDKRGQTN